MNGYEGVDRQGAHIHFIYGDDYGVVYVNGELMGRGMEWCSPGQVKDTLDWLGIYYKETDLDNAFFKDEADLGWEFYESCLVKPYLEIAALAEALYNDSL